ncbi:hypothetical protein OBBRIDRAFT_802410 [Obba rivulosa]|uniref:Uncharacterized protein n=1 Tax=Obba rivulosa TaxID=1052685 RepID=A0A8E2AX42_9APHY|nr:hypothetical protein OBBRIDRAFT_802410 [Obba rivulosa]
MQLTVSTIVLAILTAVAGVTQASPLEARQILCATDADCDLGFVCDTIGDTGESVCLPSLSALPTLSLDLPVLSTSVDITVALPTVPALPTSIDISIALPTVTL